MAWEDWFQDVAGSVVKSAADAKFTQPYEIQKLQLQALGQLGMYNEGKPQAVASPGLLGMSQGATVLLIAGALLAVYMLKD